MLSLFACRGRKPRGAWADGSKAMSAIQTAIADVPVDAVDRILAQMSDESAQHQICGRDDSRVPVQAPVRLGVIPGCSDPTDPRADPGRFTSLYDAWATDLSQTGIGLLAGHDLPMDVLMWLSIDALAGYPQLLAVRIAYCTQLLPSTYRIGAIFLPSA